MQHRALTSNGFYYAALLRRTGPHIASHSVCLSVCLSVRPSRACILTKIGHVFSSNLADVWHLLFCLHLRGRIM